MNFVESDWKIVLVILWIITEEGDLSLPRGAEWLAATTHIRGGCQTSCCG